MIKSLSEQGIGYIDFPAEPYEWEKQWSEEFNNHQTIFIYGKTLKGKLLSLLQRMYNLKTKLKTKNKNDTINFTNPKKINRKKIILFR